jgi:hypothetical protein
LAPGNYEKYRGKNNQGVKKTQFCTTIAAKMNAAKVRETRTAKQVANKIDWLEKSFKRADNFAHYATGEGIKEDDPRSYEEKLHGICPFYQDLLPIMGDRVGNPPKDTSDDLLLESDNEDLANIADDAANEEEENDDEENDEEVEASVKTSERAASKSNSSSTAAAAPKRSRSISPPNSSRK